MLAGSAATSGVGTTGADLADTAAVRTDVDAVPTLWWTTGTDALGQHGDGATDAGSTTASRVSWRPGIEVPRGDRVQQVAAGDSSACAIVAGRAYCWGDNSSGQLGDGSLQPSADPVAVATAPTGGSVLPADAVVTDISVGAGATCAVADAEVYCWGDNSSGQLGHDSPAGSSVPVAVATDGAGGSAMPSATATRVVTGGGGAGSTTSFSCAVTDGNAYCWGSREDGRLGNGVRNEIPSLVPVSVDTSWNPAIPVADLSIGAHSACLSVDGSAYCWGSSLNGTIGNGVNDPGTDFAVPQPVLGGDLPFSNQVSSVTVGASSACAVHDGDLYCWGTNMSGQLGADLATDTEPTTTVVHVPTAVAVQGNGASELPADATVLQVAAGGRLDGPDGWCALAERTGESPRPYCWGDGVEGRSGLGAAGDQRVPRALFLHPFSELPAGVELAGIAAGDGFTTLWAEP